MPLSHSPQSIPWLLNGICNRVARPLGRLDLFLSPGGGAMSLPVPELAVSSRSMIGIRSAGPQLA